MAKVDKTHFIIEVVGEPMKKTWVFTNCGQVTWPQGKLLLKKIYCIGLINDYIPDLIHIHDKSSLNP